MKREISRRDLLKVTAALAGSVGLWKVTDLLSAPKALPVSSIEGTPEAVSSFLPLVHGEPGAIPTPTSPPPPTGSRVVHAHSSNATSWSGQTDYWNHVDQGVVNNMVDQGLMTLTGASTVAAAWQALLPNYQVGQGIAVKVNFNNSTKCADADNQIDALVHPVNAMVRGLQQAGVALQDIWIYDAKRVIPDRFMSGNLYPGVQFFDKVCRSRARWDSTDAHAYVAYSPPGGTSTPPATKISDVLIDATYLINMPIIKPHGYTGVTLAFKNHFGTIDIPADLHDYVGLNWSQYRSDYSLFVDMYKNPHIAGKTVLTIGDGLFAAKAGTTSPPEPWASFGNDVPNSLFFATDPVAIDCVMCDFLAAETSIPATSDDYLRLAGTAGLGAYERGDPWGSGYNILDYRMIQL